MRTTILFISLLFLSVTAISKSPSFPTGIRSIEVRTEFNNVNSSGGRAAFNIYYVYESGTKEKGCTATADKYYNRSLGAYEFTLIIGCGVRGEWCYRPEQNRVDRLFSGESYSCSSLSEAIQIVVEVAKGLR